MATASATFTTTWVPPDPATGFSKTVVEESSHIILEWEVSTLDDVDFLRYSVERRDKGTVDWTVIANISSKEVTTWIDIFTGHGQEVEYRVVVWKDIPGDSPLPSEGSEIIDAMLESDVWFVIGNEDPNTTYAFELPVASQGHTRPIQQEVFEPIANNRKKVARGNVLGYEGSLTIRWTNEERAVAKDRLNFLATNAGPHVLKSPFGDVWRVEFDAPDFKYSGGGHMQVEIGWVEVV